MEPAHSQPMPTSETNVLRMLSQGAPVKGVLNELCNFIDAKSPGVIPTVFLLNSDGTQLQVAAGPKFPKIWDKAFDGLKMPVYASFQNTAGRPEEAVRVADRRRLRF